MKIPWQRIKNRSSWFWGAVGALCIALVLLVLSSLPKSEPVADFDDEAAAAIPQADTFLSVRETTILSALLASPTEPGDSVSIDHIVIAEETTSTQYTAYKSVIPSVLESTYVVSALPTTDDAMHVFRILYQSVPYLTQEEVVSLLTQKGLAKADSLTMDDIVAATQLAINSIINDMHYDFASVDSNFPLIKPLYEYYMGISADTPAAPVTFRIDTMHAMWASGQAYGPLRILPSIDGYAQGAKFNLEPVNDTMAEYIYIDAASQPITSIGVNEPFYLKIENGSGLPDAEHMVSVSATAQSELSYGGDVLTLTPAPSTPTDAVESAASLYGPVLNGTLFSAYSVRAKPTVSATIQATTDMLK